MFTNSDEFIDERLEALPQGVPSKHVSIAYVLQAFACYAAVCHQRGLRTRIGVDP